MEKLVNSFEGSDNPYIYVAEIQTNDTSYLAGFIKGSSWAAGKSMQDIVTQSTNVACKDELAELGSLYIAPCAQGQGIGKLLTSKLAQDALLRGYTKMVTSAYAKNTSPKFFIKKTGAILLGNSPIPNYYYEDLLADKGLLGTDMPPSIPGVVLYWTHKALEQIAQLAP